MNTSNLTEERLNMFRKMTLVLAATAALGAVALAPTSASAWGHGGWGGHHFGWGGFGAGIGLGLVGSAVAANSYYNGYYYGYGNDTCLRRRVVDTYYGPRWRWVNVCY
jgi:hypothetical protein